MKPLFVLITVFVISLFATRFQTGDYHHFLSGKIAMAAMLAFTALGHFIYTKGMAMMVPDFVPFKKGVVYFTGLLELVFAVALLIPNHIELTCYLLMFFLMLTLQANIKAATEHIDYQKATHNGPGPKYLWFRLPLQLFFIFWVYFFGLNS
jgi:uncharacterized membrane protein